MNSLDIIRNSLSSFMAVMLAYKFNKYVIHPWYELPVGDNVHLLCKFTKNRTGMNSPANFKYCPSFHF